MSSVLSILVILLGASVMFAAGWIAKSKSLKFVGNLRVDQSDDDGPYIFIEFENDPSMLVTSKHVMMRVIKENYISQK